MCALAGEFLCESLQWQPFSLVISSPLLEEKNILKGRICLAGAPSRRGWRGWGSQLGAMLWLIIVYLMWRAVIERLCTAGFQVRHLFAHISLSDTPLPPCPGRRKATFMGLKASFFFQVFNQPYWERARISSFRGSSARTFIMCDRHPETSSHSPVAEVSTASGCCLQPCWLCL